MGPFEYVGRDASASPATGSHHVHEREQKLLVDGAFAVNPVRPHRPGVRRLGGLGGNGDAGPTATATARSRPGKTETGAQGLKPGYGRRLEGRSNGTRISPRMKGRMKSIRQKP
jgi:hypothetical protein